MKYTIGQKLWWVPPHNQYHKERNGGCEVNVTKVGTKYVTVEAQAGETSTWKWTHVFVKTTGLENTTTLHQGRAWITREAYEENRALLGSWRVMCKLARDKLQEHRSVPSNLTTAQIERITGILESLS